MMETYILIMIVSGSYASGRIAVSTQEFNSKETCETAIVEIYNKPIIGRPKHNVSTWHDLSSLVCVKK